MSGPRSVLVRAPNWAGDVVMATPGFRALRERFPEARLVLQILPGLAPLLDGAPWFDEVLPLTSHRKGTAALLREGHALRSRGFELGLCLPDSVSSALLMRAAGVGRIVGYGRGLRGVLLHESVPPLSGDDGSPYVPRERHVLGLVAAVGGKAEDSRLELFVTAAEESEAEAAFTAGGLAAQAPLVALAPGASYGPSKCWPAESFAEVADALSERGISPVLVGAPSEREISARVVAAATRPVLDLTGAISLGALKAVLRRARLLVCNDAGARHVAVAFGTPAVCLFGPTSVEKTKLNLERVKVLVADVACRPCYHRVCPIDHRCMTRILPGEVLTASESALAGPPAPAEGGPA